MSFSRIEDLTKSARAEICAAKTIAAKIKKSRVMSVKNDSQMKRSKADELRQRLRRNVATEMRAVEMDFFNSSISSGLRGFQILAQRCHAKNATAAGDDFISFFRRSRVKNFYARQFRRVVQSANRLFLFIISRITAAGHHHTNTRFRFPAQFHFVERAAHT